MPKLPRVSSKQVIKALKQIGFTVNHISGSHYIFYKNGCLPVTVPFHNKDLKLGTLSNILKQSGLTVQEFIDLL